MALDFNQASLNGQSHHDVPSLADAKQYIYALDFSALMNRLKQEAGWRDQALTDTCAYYRNFLFLNKKYPERQVLPPSDDIDEFWHAHILDTEQYARDCLAIFGKYFHHYPYLVFDEKMSKNKLQQHFEVTQQLHLKEFGTLIYTTRSKYQKIKYLFSQLLKIMKE